jgi:hypothetical protein
MSSRRIFISHYLNPNIYLIFLTNRPTHYLFSENFSYLNGDLKTNRSRNRVRDGSGILSFFFKKERYIVQPDPDGVYGGWGTPKKQV